MTNADTKANLAALSASGVFDARGKSGALPAGINRLVGSEPVAGPIVTARCHEGSVSAVVAALDTCSPGDILVIQGAGEWAYFGELTGAEAIRHGVVAVVADCYVRDIDHLAGWPIQVFARGLTPQGAGFGPPGEACVPITVGEVVLDPGDWLVGDADGVVAVPAAEIEDALGNARELVATEAGWASGVLRGEALLDQAFADGSTLRDRLEARQGGC